MLTEYDKRAFSGAAKIWRDFATQNPELSEDGALGIGAVIADQFRDEYVRLPYDDVPHSHECIW